MGNVPRCHKGRPTGPSSVLHYGGQAVGGTAGLAACATRELDFGGPGAVGRVGIEEAGEWLGEVGEFVTSGLTATDAYGAGAHAQREETPSEAGFGEEMLAVLC